MTSGTLGSMCRRFEATLPSTNLTKVLLYLRFIGGIIHVSRMAGYAIHYHIVSCGLPHGSATACASRGTLLSLALRASPPWISHTLCMVPNGKSALIWGGGKCISLYIRTKQANCCAKGFL